MQDLEDKERETTTSLLLSVVPTPEALAATQQLQACKKLWSLYTQEFEEKSGVIIEYRPTTPTQEEMRALAKENVRRRHLESTPNKKPPPH
jgi:hypothetical protein